MIHQAHNCDSQLPQFTFLLRGHLTDFSDSRSKKRRFLLIRLRSMNHQAHNCNSQLPQFPFLQVFYRGHVTDFQNMFSYWTVYTDLQSKNRFVNKTIRCMIYQARNCDSQLPQLSIL